MTQFTLSIQGQKPLIGDLSLITPEPLPLPEGIQLFRVLHDQELWNKGIRDPRNSTNTWRWRAGFPEVYNFDGSHVTRMLEWVQKISFALNPGMDPKKWRVLYDDHRAFSNGSGFDTTYPPTDPRYTPKRDYVNRIDLDSVEYPRFDKSRICGGATIAGRVSGDWLEVDTLRVDHPVTLEWLLPRPWLYFDAVTVSSTSTDSAETVGKFPQNDGRRCLVPLVTTTAVRYPLAWLEAVTQIADPYYVSAKVGV